MKLHAILIAILVLVLGMTAGCRVSPIRDISDQPVYVTKNGYTLDDMTQAITRAGVGLGWAMKPIEPGHMEATLYIRSHMAQVDIFYDPKTYTIKYKDSDNLNYDASTGEIHSNYNGWVQNLDNAIKRELANMT